MNLEEFASIDDRMLWKGAALKQIEEFKALAERLGCEPVVVGCHTSKSIRLPVVRLCVGGCVFLLRDNFYTVEMAVSASDPVTLPMAEMLDGLCEAHDWDWYLEQIAKARGYSWKGWSDEEMADWRILRVKVKHDNGGEYVSKMDPDRKDRWAKRLEDPEWYSRDWAGAQITSDEPFGPGAVMFAQQHLYAEGIGDLVASEDLGPYESGKCAFGPSLLNCEEADVAIRRLTA
jgi:hypothetical protein